AVLINFTNPAGLITQAISAQGKVRAVGVCDTPSGTIADLAAFAGARGAQAADAGGHAAGRVVAKYGGLNHLRWITSCTVDGPELIGDLPLNWSSGLMLATIPR